jgi:CheY-like chemotaxis protein
VHCGAAGPQGCPVTFSVTDTGRGIAATDIPRLFQDFGMLERNPTQELGTGLGLAICRRLAEAMGGTVGVDTTPGAGSSFWLRVTLPVARMPAPAGTQNSAPHTGAVPEVPSGALAGLRVLVAEDHDLIRQLTCINLTRWGAQAVEAADGHQAVAMAGVTSFDLILLDLRMPGLDGESAASAIRQGAGPSAQARILGLTADRIPATLAGVGADGLAGSALDGCLAKPLDLWQLIALLGGVARPMSAPDPIQDFDNETVRHLRDLDGGTVLARTLEKFSAEIETARADLARHIAQGDLDSARQRAHGLAGLCDILGVFRLAEALRRLELIAASTTRTQTLHDALNELDIVLVLSREQADLLAGQARACAMGPEGSDAPPA